MASPKVVSGQVVGPDGVGRRANITVTLTAQAVVNGNQEVATSPIKVSTNDTGVWSVSLYANGDMTPATTKYTVVEQAADGSAQTNLTIVVPQTAGPFNAAAIQG